MHHILCMDDDLHFCQVIRKEATALGIQLTIASSLKKAKQKINTGVYSAYIVNDKYFEEGLAMKKASFLVYKALPSIDKLKELKKKHPTSFVGGKPLHAIEAQYLLSKLCRIQIKHESACDWVDEIPDTHARLFTINFRKTG